MSLLHIAWRNIIKRKVETFITLIIIAFGVAMFLSVFLLSQGLKEGIKQASEPYGMLVGSKGSPTQLVLNTIFLTDTPIGNIDYSYYETLKADPRVVQAIPIGLGDNHKGLRIVGTSREFFELKKKPMDPPTFSLKEGRLFEHPFEIVLGAKAAEQTGLKIGDTFTAGHGIIASGVEEEDGGGHEEHPYTVVGILEERDAPSDLGIYTPLESYWISHGEDDGGKNADGSESSADHGVTAILVKPDSYANLLGLYQSINNGKEAQAVLPGKVLAKMFDLMGNGQEVLKIISYIVLFVGGLTVMLSLYGSMVERRRSVSILRAIGASRQEIMKIVLWESWIILMCGSLLGIGLGYALSAVLAHLITQQSAIGIVLLFDWNMLLVILGICLLGMMFSLIPAYSVCRTEVAKYLYPV